MANVQNLQILRGILRELRYIKHKEPLRKNIMYNYVLDQYRRYQATGNKYCRGEHEMRHMGQTYLCLLQSQRMMEKIQKQYKGAGEVSTERAANMVGLNLPETVEDHPK